MISHIKGTVEYIGDGFAVIEANGVGYGISVTYAALAQLKINTEAKVYTYMHVKEDGIGLYGFLARADHDMFVNLISVSGVGPKVAMSLLGAMKPGEITQAVLLEDISAFVKAPGIGKKTAQMIIFKLKDKLLLTETQGAAGAQISLNEAGGPKADAVEALAALGYGRSEALKAVLEIALPDMKTEQIIKAALRKLV